jgi:ABC-type nitrate/sulfonate/bicarbonate transport system permease component
MELRDDRADPAVIRHIVASLEGFLVGFGLGVVLGAAIGGVCMVIS